MPLWRHISEVGTTKKFEIVAGATGPMVRLLNSDTVRVMETQTSSITTALISNKNHEIQVTNLIWHGLIRLEIILENSQNPKNLLKFENFSLLGF